MFSWLTYQHWLGCYRCINKSLTLLYLLYHTLGMTKTTRRHLLQLSVHWSKIEEPKTAKSSTFDSGSDDLFTDGLSEVEVLLSFPRFWQSTLQMYKLEGCGTCRWEDTEGSKRGQWSRSTVDDKSKVWLCFQASLSLISFFLQVKQRPVKLGSKLRGLCTLCEGF